MKEFDANTYKDRKGDFNDNDENLLISLLGKGNIHGRVLDIGCGDGKLSRRIKESFPQLEILAIDSSREQIDIATSSPSDISFQLADIVDFSPADKFDFVWSFYAFPHISKSRLLDALKSTKRLLKEGGYFYLFTNICLFDTSNATLEEQEACDVLFLNNWPSQIHLVSLPEMEELYKEAGFEKIQDKKLETGAKIKKYGDMVSWIFILK